MRRPETSVPSLLTLTNQVSPHIVPSLDMYSLSSIVGTLRLNEIKWPIADPLRLGVLSRHAMPVIFNLQAIHNLHRNTSAGEAVLWLSSITDSAPVTLRLPIYTGDSNQSVSFISLSLRSLML